MKKALFILLITIFTVTTIHAEWNEIQKLLASDGGSNDRFGYSVSISGDYMVVGAYCDDDLGNNSGSAYIFHRDIVGWTQQAKLTANDGAANNIFGFSVSISGDFVIVGAYGDNDFGNNSGSAYIFQRDGSSWNQQVKLIAYDGAEEDRFGYSVSISGDYAIVGAYGDDDLNFSSGSAYVYHREGTEWNHYEKLTADDGGLGNTFGWSVSIDGDYAVIGAANDDDLGNMSGSAYIFYKESTIWSQQAKLKSDDGVECDYFGRSVSICGDDVIIGVPGDGDLGASSGSAYIFHREGSTWTQQTKLVANDGAESDCFGISVSISGEDAIVGAYLDDTLGSNSGSAYIYRREGIAWAQEVKLIASDGAELDYFGWSVSINSEYAIAGAWDDGYGSAYIFQAPIPGTGTANGTPADDDPLPVAVEPLDPYDYNGGGAVVVDPDVDIDPEEVGAAIAVDVVVTVGNGDVMIPVNACLTYEVTVTGTIQPVEIVLHFDGLPFEPDELVWNNGGVWVAVPGVVWNYVDQTATFTWTFDSPLRDGGEEFVMNEGDGSTLPVELSSFSATVTSQNFAKIEWATQSECDIAGYNLLRADNDVLDDAMRVNLQLIPGENASDGASYRYIDEDVTKNSTYNYWLESVELNGSSTLFGPVSVTIAEEGGFNEPPVVTYLTEFSGVYPNPFNPVTTISYSLKQDGRARFTMFDIRGRKVEELTPNGKKGDNTLTWDAEGLPSGIYFIRMTADNIDQTRKVMILK